ncbi:MAG: hypothetical protein Q7S27_00235 [Nanoarchaeota archaeon]|nr:hypothetical protein [Nanoarchaeota archaeon]
MKNKTQSINLEKILQAYANGTTPDGLEIDNTIRKPMGYWRDFQHVKTTLEELEKILGHFPNQREMSEKGYTSLPSALNKYHGGLNKVAESLGKLTQQRARGYWKPSLVKSLCQNFAEEYGHFPSNKELHNRDDKYKGLMSGINKYGGIGRIKRLLKIEPGKKPNDYWSEARVLTEARKIVRKLGTLPTQKQLINLGYSNFVGAVANYSSFIEIRRTLGLELNKVEDGYWTEKKILSECKKLVERLGDLPTKDGLQDLKLGALAGQIEKQGGYPYFREKLGLTLRKRQNRYWSKDNTYAKARELYEKFGTLPSWNKLEEMQLGTLPNAAREHFGGLVKLRNLLQEEFGDVQEDPLKDMKYLQEEIKKVQEKHKLKKFPGYQTLNRLGYSQIISAIKRYHGGSNNVREGAGEKAVSPNGTWQDPKFVLSEAKKLMKKHGWKSWPAEGILRKYKYTMIPNAIRACYGSIAQFRVELGEEPLRTVPGKWKDLEYTLTEARKAMEEIGYTELPPQKVLANHGYQGLSAAISIYYGGFPAFRDILNQHLGNATKKVQLEGLLRDYVRRKNA